MTKVKVNPGVCGLKTTIDIDTEDMQEVTVKLESDCPYIMQMQNDIVELDGFSEVFAKFGDSKVFEAANKYCKHAACPVPTAIIKGIEKACGLALAKNVEIIIE